jgi:hypothetical protein
MTGPEHYREAERLLATAYEDNLTTYEGENPAAARNIAEAQVHATLALAAATALPATRPGSATQMALVRTVHGMEQHGTPEEATR